VKIQKGYDYIESDIERLVHNAIGLGEIERRTGYSFPPMGSISGLNTDAHQQEDLAALIGERLSGTTYYNEIPETPSVEEEPEGYRSGSSDSSSPSDEPVETGTSETEVLTRVGQGEFSDKVRNNYNHSCCFPECGVSDARYLIGAHIARWADRPDLRGDVSNGLCLCLHHDKAFEIGHFTIDQDLRVWTTDDQIENSPWAREHILPYDGQPIDEGDTPPHPEALKEHWQRHGFALE
jgi:hypothetical protein